MTNNQEKKKKTENKADPQMIQTGLTHSTLNNYD